MIRPLVRSYGENSTSTLSPGRMRMKCLRILPEMWASTLCLFSSSTWNIALGNVSRTVAVTSIASSFDMSLLVFLLPQYQRAVLRHGHGMLEMGGQGPVDGPRRPAVVVRADVLDHPVRPRPRDARAQLPADLAEHRLDGQHHSLAQFQTAAALPVVVDLRLLVHLPADSMADEVADDVEAARLGVLLNRRTDVAQMPARTHLLDREIETFLRRPDQLLRPRRHLAHRDRDGAVTDEPVEDGAEVEADDVALLQLRPVRDAVDDHVVGR